MGLEVNHCCGCIQLRTGCLIIGYINLVVDIIFTILMIMGVAAGGIIQSQGQDDKAKTVGVLMLAGFGIGLVLFIILLAFTIVLLVGVHQRKPRHIKVYLVYAGIMLVMYAIGFFGSFAAGFNVLNVIRDIVYIVAQVYFLIVIKSYLTRMNDTSNRPAIYSTA